MSLTPYVWAIILIAVPLAARAQAPTLPATGSLAVETDPKTTEINQWADLANVGGHARFDYFSASKRLDGNHHLAGLTLQPKAAPKFGSWGDGKIEGRLTDQDITSPNEPTQGRLLEAYGNVYAGRLDLRLGKQIIPWGRADGYNPTDVLTPQDYRVLSALYETDRRTGTTGIRANYASGSSNVQLIWLPFFNPSAIPIPATPGLREEKASNGDWADQGIALKWDYTSSAVDWSLSFYHGRNLLPQVRPGGPSELVLFHNQINMVGADFATTVGQYGIRGEAAYIQTADIRGNDPLLINPSFTYVLGVDRSVTEDFSVNVQAYQRYILNFQSPFSVSGGTVQNLAVLNAIVNQQLDQYQGGFTGRVKATWLNKTLEAELLGVVNFPRRDFYLRPMIGYALTDALKTYLGGDIFNGQRNSFFGRLENVSALFLELRATL